MMSNQGVDLTKEVSELYEAIELKVAEEVQRQNLEII